MADARLSIRSLDKSFAAPALRQVELTIGVGEIHALVGENGAGKSTLASILAGVVRKDAGELRLDGKIYEPCRARDGFRAGVSLAAQELSIIGSLTVAENIALRELPSRRFVVDRIRLHEDAVKLLATVGLGGIDPTLPAAALSLAERQLLELAKAIRSPCRLLILDEPTAALTASQAARVHRLIRKLVTQNVSIIYISHRLDDVLELADTVTVLRDGEVVQTAPSVEFSAATLIEQMTGGRSGPTESSVTAVATVPSPLLEARNLQTADLRQPLSLCCGAGEILGIAGLAGAGKSELMRALFRLEPATCGEVVRHIGGSESVLRDSSHAISLGVGFLGEDRQSMGLFPGLSLLDNMMVPGARRTSIFGLADRRSERASGSNLVRDMAIRCEGLDQEIGQLSGGNQQKSLIARWLHRGSEILLFDEPTRGVDVSTKHTIYELLFDLQAKGSGIIVASSEIDELMAICSRILVLSNRVLVTEFARGDWTEADILTAAFQQYSTQSSSRDSSSAKDRVS